MSLQSYIKNQSFNRLNESELLVNYGKDLDSVQFKVQQYANYQFNNVLNESSNNFKFTPNESNAISNVLVSICEDYKKSLEEELSLYEKYLNGELNINESNIFKSLVDKGKERLNNIKDSIKNIKFKIKEVGDFISSIIKNGIDSVKSLIEKLMQLLEKFKCNIEELVKKIGLDPKEIEDSFLNDNDLIIKNINDLKKDNIYESLGNEIKQQLISEADDNKKDDSQNTDSKVVNQGKQDKGWKTAIKKLLLGIVKWALVCVVIPGVVIAFFPGTFLALLVPIACKLAWNGYTIWKIWKQFKKVQKEWKTMKKWQKWLSVISMIGSIIAIGFNFATTLPDMKGVLKGFVDNGCELMTKANLGIQPDALQRGFAAFVDMIKEKKLSLDDFQASYQAITNSFAKISQETIDKVVQAAAEFGKSGEEFLKNFEEGHFKTPVEFWKSVKDAGINIKDIKDGSMVDVAVDGFFANGSNNWSSKAMDIAKEMGLEKYLDPSHALNKGLNKICAKQGSITGFSMPIELVKKLAEEGCLGNKNIFTILGGVTSEVTATVVQDVITAATSMVLTLPIVEYAPDNAGGFRVRLGEEGSENFVYEINKDGVREEKFEDTDKLKELIDKTKEYHKQLEENAKSDEDKEKVQKAIKEFNERFNSEIKDIKRVVFYGKKVEEEKDEKEESKNESKFMSLTEYILEKKSYNIENPDKEAIFKNLDDLRKYIEKQCPAYSKTEENGKKLIQKADTTLAGSTQIILRSIFATKDTSKTSNFLWDKEFTKDKTDDAKKSIRKRAQTETKADDKFGPDDIYKLSVYLNKNVYTDSKSEDLDAALVDIIILKNSLKSSDEISDTVKAAYIKMVENFSKSSKFKEGIGSKWEPGKNWAPLNFEIKKISDETKNEIEKTEEKVLPTPEKQDAIEDTVEKEDNKKEDNKKEEDKKDTDKKDNENEEVPVLEFIPFFNAWDIADADSNGPRKEPYSFKGCFLDLEFIAIEGGTSQDKLETMLGDLLYNMVNNCYNLIADKPCIKDGKKLKVNENSSYKEDEERPELGSFTNKEITEILSDKKNAKKYLSMATGKITVAKTKKEKAQLEEIKKQNESVKDSEELKKLKPELYDKEGNIKEEEWKKFNEGWSNYRLGKRKKEKSKGFFAKIWDNIKNFFGFKTDDYEAADKILSKKKKTTNESLDYPFRKPLSLKSYMEIKMNK